MFLSGTSLPAGWLQSRHWQLDKDYTVGALALSEVEAIRQWRNSQAHVLRQTSPISVEDQSRWYHTVVVPTHSGVDPQFLLVSLRFGGVLVAYGGLTNIVWTSRRAEVSFLAETQRAADAALYAQDMWTFLTWLDRLAFDDLLLNRMYAETYTFRSEHISLLERYGYRREGCLRLHTIKNGRLVDSVIHGRVRDER